MYRFWHVGKRETCIRRLQIFLTRTSSCLTFWYNAEQAFLHLALSMSKDSVPFPAPIFSVSLAATYQDGQSWWLPSFLNDEVKKKVIGGWFTGGHFQLIVSMGYVCRSMNSGNGLRWLNEEGLLPLGYLWPQFKQFAYSYNSVVWTWP